MLSPAINQHRNTPSIQHVKTAANQWKSVLGQVAHRRNIIELPIKPRLHIVLVGGSDVRQMSWLQRSDMCIDHFGQLSLLDARPCRQNSLPAKIGNRHQNYDCGANRNGEQKKSE